MGRTEYGGNFHLVHENALHCFGSSDFKSFRVSGEKGSSKEIASVMCENIICDNAKSMAKTLKEERNVVPKVLFL